MTDGLKSYASSREEKPLDNCEPAYYSNGNKWTTMKQLDQLLEIESITIDNEEYSTSLIKEAIHLSGNLADDFSNQAKYVAIIGFGYERALRLVAQLEVQLDRIYALCDARARNNALVENRKVTEKIIEGEVKTSEEYQLHQNKLLEARYQSGILKTLKEALVHKKDALVGSAANYRAELAAERTMLRDE